MSSVILAGDTSGTLTVSAPLVAGSNTLTLPAATGTLQTIGVGTAVASTSGTSIDFTSIPSWVKRITVMLSGVSTSGSSAVVIQVGSGSVSTSGYFSTASYAGGAGTFLYITNGFTLDTGGTAGAAAIRYGAVQLVLLNNNTWCLSGNIGFGSLGQVSLSCAGTSPTLSGALDRVRITSSGGTDTFDAGSINIMYEG
jgi:hypothetical protein